MNKMEIEKARMMSIDMTQKNIEKIQKIFPNAVTEVRDDEGVLKLAIDFNVLKQELSESLITDKQERYQMTWPDKKQSILLANQGTIGTLRPLISKSCDFNNTKNLYIEGDNLDVLKLLRETYLNKIKVIYIDPPYNTGSDFIYEDDFSEDFLEYVKRSGQQTEEGLKLVQNTETNGRFHTDWLNMIYPRLKVAKDLLSDDGVIYISIDDGEQANLKKVCNEIFGESNFLAQIVWERAYSPINLKKHFSVSHDYMLCYAKNINSLVCNGLPRDKEATDRYMNPDSDSRGPWKSACLYVGPRVESNVYPIVSPSGKEFWPNEGYSWLFSKERMEEMRRDDRIYFGPKGDSTPSLKRFLSEVKQTVTPMSIWKYSDVGHSQEAMQSLKKLFEGKVVFDYPKPVELIKRALQLYTNKDSIVLDFFSGSATTAHACMKLNSEDGGNRQFIMVQLPEICDEKSNAFKAGYNTICDIGEDRIRRAGKMIKNEVGILGENLDVGFRVFKLDSSNVNEVYYNPKAMTQNLLEATVDNIKPDRNSLDLLFQVMLECGAMLSSKIEEKEINGKKVFVVEDNYIAACFDDRVDDKTVEVIAKLKPIYACFKGSSFDSDSANINAEQIFKTYSPNTEKIKVI